MNLYFWLILFAYILILARGVIRGFERGFVKELEGLAAGICAVLTLILIREFSTKALAIGLLMVLGIVYSLCRILFSSLKLFAGLPVIRFLDQVLGAGAGVCKSFLLLYVVDHIVKIWLNL